MDPCAEDQATIDQDQNIHEGDNRISTRRRSTRGGWHAVIFVMFVEMVERFAFYGLATNLITYLTNELHETTAVAAKNVNNWVGVASLLPLVGAFVADSLLGRFTTILFASIIYCTGMGFLSLSVSIIPRRYREVLFFISLYVVAFGEGGHKPCVLTFAADQFGEDSILEKKRKSSFYNWWNLAIATGASSANFGVLYVQDNLGWSTGFGMVAGAMAVALAAFLLGIKRYRRQGPVGSPFTSMAQVFVAAARKRKMSEMRDGHGVYYGNEGAHNVQVPRKPVILARTNQFKFLDKAMIMDHVEASTNLRNPWRLCSVNQVEELKLVLRLIPTWLFSLMFAVVNSLLGTYFTKQASTMIRTIGSSKFKLPAASLQGIVALTNLVAIPIYDQVFIPITQRFTGHPSGISVLQRIGVGLFLSILNMVTSALVEAKRIGVAQHYELLDNPKAEVPIRVWWLLPQYMLCALSNAFTFIGLQELFYDQVPLSMRSLGSAANLSITGMGNFLSSAIISMVEGISSRYGSKWLDDNINRAHLDYFYYMMAGLSGLNLCFYLWFANSFVYKKVQEEEEEETNGVESSFSV